MLIPARVNATHCQMRAVSGNTSTAFVPPALCPSVAHLTVVDSSRIMYATRDGASETVDTILTPSGQRTPTPGNPVVDIQSMHGYTYWATLAPNGVVQISNDTVTVSVNAPTRDLYLPWSRIFYFGNNGSYLLHVGFSTPSPSLWFVRTQTYTAFSVTLDRIGSLSAYYESPIDPNVFYIVWCSSAPSCTLYTGNFSRPVSDFGLRPLREGQFFGAGFSKQGTFVFSELTGRTGLINIFSHIPGTVNATVYVDDRQDACFGATTSSWPARWSQYASFRQSDATLFLVVPAPTLRIVRVSASDSVEFYQPDSHATRWTPSVILGGHATGLIISSRLPTLSDVQPAAYKYESGGPVISAISGFASCQHWGRGIGGSTWLSNDSNPIVLASLLREGSSYPAAYSFDTGLAVATPFLPATNTTYLLQYSSRLAGQGTFFNRSETIYFPAYAYTAPMQVIPSLRSYHPFRSQSTIDHESRNTLTCDPLTVAAPLSMFSANPDPIFVVGRCDGMVRFRSTVPPRLILNNLLSY